MSLERPPAFQFYPRDFESDGRVEAMENEEVGAYVRILCKAWFQDPPGSVPNDEKTLARWSRTSVARWKKISAAILACFELRDDGRYHQKRMQKVDMEQANYRQRMEKRAKTAAAARWKDGDVKQSSSNANASPEDMLNHAPSSSTSSAPSSNCTKDSSASSEAGAGAPTGFPQNGSDPKRQPTWNAVIMPVLREMNFAADDTDGDLCKRLVVDSGVPVSDVDAAIRGLRLMCERDELERSLGLKAGEQLNMKMLVASVGKEFGFRPIWNEAAEAHWKESGERPPAGGPKRLKVVVG